MPFRSLFLALLLTLSACAQKLDKLPGDSLGAINPTELRMHLSFLASEELGGRYTLAPNFAVAAKYLSTRLEAYGYKGAANGSFFQKFDVMTSQAEPNLCLLSLLNGVQRTDYHYGQFFNSGFVGGDVEGPIVFVGHGISSPSQGYDDYANLDVRGKIVLIGGGTPEGIDASRLGENGRGSAAAAAHGAVAAFLLPARYMLALMRSPAARNSSRERAMLAVDKEHKIPEIRLGPDLADLLLAEAGTTLNAVLDGNDKDQPLQPRVLQTSAKLHMTMQQTQQASQNVVAVLEGTDPRFKSEYVAFSAHYDHLKTSPEGKVYPGADDDGSGTSSVLTIAKALSVHRPKRSVLIIFHAGEELGLLGSEYNADYAPVVPLAQIVTDINIDMVGRTRDSNPKNQEIAEKGSIFTIGADKISSELSQVEEKTNQEYEKLKFDYTLNDPNEPQQFYFRSDHWNYAKHGIPIIFFFDGPGEDYHQPTDTVDKIDFDQMARVARLAYGTGYRVANLDHRLNIDHPVKSAD